MWLYISEQEVFTDFGNEKALAWHETNIPYAIWGPESVRFHHVIYDPTEVIVFQCLYIEHLFTLIRYLTAYTSIGFSRL